MQTSELSSSDVTGLMQDVVKAASPIVEYVDALYTNSESLNISKDSAEEKLSHPSSTKGVVFRMLKKGEWREAAYGDLRDKAKILEEVREKANFNPISDHVVQNISRGKPWKTNVERVGKKDPRNLEPTEKLELVKRYFEVAKSQDSRIINVDSNYAERWEERIFVNSEGSELRSLATRVHFFLLSMAKENDRVEYDYLVNGRTGGLEILDEIIDDEKAREVSKNAIQLLGAGQVPTGTFNVILDFQLAGTFAHESFGHGCEADQVLRGRSYLINYLDKKLGPEEFNLYDDGTMSGGYGSLVFDDEGNPPHKTMIVEKGVLRRFLNDRMSAEEMNATPTGNARRESYKRTCYVRMTNTCVGPGNYSFEELLKETRDGIFLERANSGVEDPIGGNMQLKSKRSWRIKNGELSEPFSTTVLSGKVLDFVANIRGISGQSDFQMQAGTCGKGHEDYVSVSDGGSYLASRAIIGQG
jgi:TldD protein